MPRPIRWGARAIQNVTSNAYWLGRSQQPGTQGVEVADNPSIKHHVENFFAIESQKPPIAQLCRVCGCIMEYRMATFSIMDSQEAWDVPIPFCAECEHFRLVQRFMDA
jgi:hypothetical protein